MGCAMLFSYSTTAKTCNKLNDYFNERLGHLHEVTGR